MTIEVERPATTGSIPERMLRALEAMVILLSRIVPSPAARTSARSYTVPVANEPIRLAAAAKRSQITMQNQGANPVTLGHGADVRYGQGIILDAGLVTSDDSQQVFQGEWWAVAAVAGPVNIGVDDQG